MTAPTGRWSFLPLAIRAYTTPTDTDPTGDDGPSRRPGRRSRRMRPWRHALVIDTETSIDASQRLLFGAYRYARIDGTTWTTIAEGVFYADDLPERDPDGYRLLREYASTRKADVDLTYLSAEPQWALELLSQRQFLKRWVHRVGYKPRRGMDPAVIVMFNAPFDWSRLAHDVAPARGDMYGGFSFTLWLDRHGRAAAWRPRLAIKLLDSRRSFKKFRQLERRPDAPGREFSGHLLDLRTLVFALTSRGESLKTACAAYEVPGKADLPEFGQVTVEALDYCRQDVAATAALAEAVLADYAAHPIELQATAAYSPASIAKAYLGAMDITPRLTAQPDFPTDVLAAAMAGFYGGRAEVAIRRVPLPVVLVDVTSMYPSVDVLLGLWHLVTADRVETVDVTAKVQHLIDTISVEDCYRPATWRQLIVLVDLVPDGHVLPVRADYTGHDALGGWSIGVNPLTTDHPMCYALPDVIASIILTGCRPKIRRAVRLVTTGQQTGLQPVLLRGALPIDPASEDFFARVVQARNQLASDDPLRAFLKVLANAGSYGIYAEMVRTEHPAGQHRRDQLHDPITGTERTATVGASETPGRFCFPPIAACITAAARLLLALIEHAVTSIGGAWVFCDTDSLAIVATPTGGLLPCPGGQHRLPDGTPAVRALSDAEVDAIRARVNQLNPYQPGTVTDLLKRETAGTCYAISAKRYAITDQSGTIAKRSEHGLGHCLDPLSPQRERRRDDGRLVWVDEVWNWILHAHVNPATPLPDWAELPALSRISVSSPHLAAPFTAWNAERDYPDQVKPFNFLLVAILDPFGYPPGADPARFRLVTPYQPDPDQWAGLVWRNVYDPNGPTYRITTDRDAPPAPDLVLVRSYRDLLTDYRLHPEHKFASPDGGPVRRSTSGQLRRRAVHGDGLLRMIGKEANRIDDVQAGAVANLADVLTTYPPDPAVSDAWWRAHVLPVLAHLPGRELAAAVGVDRRSIDRIRAGTAPRPATAARLVIYAAALARASLRDAGQLTGTFSDAAALAEWRTRRAERAVE